MKKFLPLLLCGSLCAASLNAQTWNCGYCGASTSCTPTGAVTATLSNGTLTISGAGAMADYSRNNHPWRGSITSVAIDSGVTGIGSHAFSDCTGLTSVAIGNSVTSIGSAAFLGCSSLASVTLGSSVATIGNSAFSGCRSLTSVAIPNRVTSIGNDAFYGCSSLTSVTIGSSVATIGSYAFWGCSRLASVTLGSGVTTIGNGAFSGCRNLSSIISLRPTPPGISAWAQPFENVDKTTCCIHVPAGAAAAYQAADGWKNFTCIQVMNTELRSARKR